MSEQIYQHFRKEEQPLIDQLLDLIRQAQDEYRPVLTHFLDPRQQYIARFLLQAEGPVKMSVHGGFAGAERKRLLFYPAYYEPTLADFELQLLEIDYPAKFVTLSHGKVLGTLANVGLERDVLGDIITDEFSWQVIVQKNISEYLVQQVDRIGKVHVSLRPKELTQLTEVIPAWEKLVISCSSLRIDVIVKAVYGLSRQRVKDMINAKKISLNWLTLERSDLEVGSKDIISVRGYGRIRFEQVLGRSKRDKLRCEVSVIRK